MQTTKQSCRTLAIAIAAAIVMTVAAARDARADGYLAPFIGFNFGGDTGAACPSFNNCQDKKLNAGFGLGSMGPVLGAELEFSYAKDFFGTAPTVSSSVLTLMGNAMLVPKIGFVRPYALAGLGLIKSHVDLSPASVLTFDNNNFGWDVGGGLMVFFGDHVGVRGDLRYFHAFQDLTILDIGLSGEKLDFGRASAALVLKF